MPPRVGIILVNYNGGKYIGECLESLRGVRSADALTVVVDNHSSDGSADFVADRFPECLLIRNTVNAGFTGGVNLGIDICLRQGVDAVLLLNPDTTAAPDLIPEFLAAMERHPGAVLAPAIFYADRRGVGASLAGAMNWSRGRMAAPFRDRKSDTLPQQDVRVDVASMCCLLIPEAVIRKIGMLDDAYFLYFEDADYLVRAAGAGVEVWYVPAAKVFHKESSATGGPHSPLAMYYFIRNRHLFVRKFKQRQPIYPLFLLYSALDVMARAGLLLMRRESAVARAVVRGAIDAVAGRAGRSAGY